MPKYIVLFSIDCYPWHTYCRLVHRRLGGKGPHPSAISTTSRHRNLRPCPSRIRCSCGILVLYIPGLFAQPAFHATTQPICADQTSHDHEPPSGCAHYISHTTPTAPTKPPTPPTAKRPQVGHIFFLALPSTPTKTPTLTSNRQAAEHSLSLSLP